MAKEEKVVEEVVEEITPQAQETEKGDLVPEVTVKETLGEVTDICDKLGLVIRTLGHTKNSLDIKPYFFSVSSGQ